MTTEQATIEPTVEEDSLEASLSDLLKAADAEDTVDALRKGGKEHSNVSGGVSYDTSGFTDESGKSGGGVTTDVGTLDSLMVGRMVQDGMPAEQAKALAGFLTSEGGAALLGKMGFVHNKRPTPAGKMKGYQGDKEDEEDEDEEMSAYARGYYDAMQEGLGKSGDPAGGKPGEDAKPGEGDPESFKKSFSEDTDIGDAVEASPFMEALTARTTEALDTLNKSIKGGRKKQDTVNKSVAVVMYQQGQLVKSQAAIIGELGKRLGIVEATPLPPKGATTDAEALNKSFGAGDPKVGDNLNKSQLASALSYMRFEKGIDTIGGQKTGELACRAESGDVTEETLDYAKKYLQTHPAQAQEALTYQ